MPVRPIKKTNNYFISTEGFVFKIVDGKEIICTPKQTPISKEIQVFINNKPYNLLYLMMEYFIGDINQNQSYKFTITKELTIPANSIIIKNRLAKEDLLPPEVADMFKYKCHAKASSANSRHEQKISPVDVYKTLAVHDFKCVYCNTCLHPNNWHLDHFNSIHKGGHNMFENIVPSCGVCNIMKGALDGFQFYKRCKMVVQNYLFKDNVSIDAHKPKVTL